jgi:uncharacterized protein YgiM (DUF1202 family)
MDFLKSFALSSLFVSAAWAAPPVDLTDPNALEPPKPARPQLKEDDIVYLDNAKRSTEEDNLTVALIDVPARSAPGRNGRVLFPIKKGDPVRAIKLSKDKRWWAVQYLRNGRSGWVPRTAVQVRKDADKKKAE